MLATTAPRVPYGAPTFMVTAHGVPATFGIDEEMFATWLAVEGDGLGVKLPDPSTDCAGSALSELVYEALSAGVLVGDPGIELNIHDSMTTDEPGYVVRLNNLDGQQLSVSLTRGWHEIHWPPKGLTSSEGARYYLQQVCDVANALLNDLAVTPV